jgi:ATP-dependent DNA helicase RecQ
MFLEAIEALHSTFGFSAFRPGQAEALEHVLAGRDTLVVMPTGSGKSLIYQLAGLMLPGTTLVISPLVALMKDQVDSLARRKVAATFINSTLDMPEYRRRMQGITNGQYKLVLVAPERLRNAAFLSAIARLPISVLAIDEAHCLSQWGHDFRPDYLRIGEARAALQNAHPHRPASNGNRALPATLALTATATPRVQDDIVHMLGLPQAERLVTGFNRPNLSFEVYPMYGANAKEIFLRDFLAENTGAGIIYVGTRKTAEEVAAYVRSLGRPAQYYHGALDAQRRTAVQDAFMAGDLPLVVATNAFGMGIDRPDVRFVLHYSVPGTMEAYYQEAGRAGRDGLPARAVLLFASRDIIMHEHFIENDTPTAEELRAAHRFLLAAGAQTDHEISTTFEAIERATGLGQNKMRVALEQLETAKALRRGASENGMLSMQVNPLTEPALRDIILQAEKRREHKHKLLALMIGYAETEKCRRRTMLDYFGDASPAEAEVCCDNCLAHKTAPGTATETDNRAAESQSERGALIVLDTIKHLKWGVGKGKLAQVLRGSTGEEMTTYAKARNFGKFAALRMTDIEALIDQLLEAGYVRQAGGARPTLSLTTRGEEALAARAAIDVNLRRVRPGATAQREAERSAGGTVLLTWEMHKRGLSIEKIAEERSMSVKTIYTHLSKLIGEGRVDVDDVVPEPVRSKIRVAIGQVGSTQYLTPIKAKLPDGIEYEVIRCVVEDWKRTHPG